MGMLTSIIGGIVIFALIVRGAIGFYDDYCARKSPLEKPESH
jgi:hypothetical protein